MEQQPPLSGCFFVRFSVSFSQLSRFRDLKSFQPYVISHSRPVNPFENAPPGATRWGESMGTDIEDELDTILDGSSLTAILAALARLCSARANGGPLSTDARLWGIAAGRLEKITASIERLGI